MTYGNLIKNKIQHVFGGLFNTLSIGRKINDAQMGCMQFGICVMLQNKLRKYPFSLLI